jgi:hypothetical protein
MTSRRALCLALIIALASAAVDRGRALADEQVLDAGRELLSYARASDLDAPRTLIVNGAQLHVLSGSTTDGLGALLDVFSARCRRASRVDRLQPPFGGRRWPRIAERALDPVLRSEGARGGYVACLDLGVPSISPQDLLGRVRRFLLHRDLAEIGDLRFAWAFRDAAVTRYVAVYTEGPLPLDRLFPTHGDAAGSDLPGVPRPAHARRLLSAYQQDAAPRIASYQTRAAPEIALQAYREQLTAAGVRVDARSATTTGRRFLATHGAQTTLAFATRSSAGDTLLTLVLLR